MLNRKSWQTKQYGCAIKCNMGKYSPSLHTPHTSLFTFSLPKNILGLFRSYFSERFLLCTQLGNAGDYMNIFLFIFSSDSRRSSLMSWNPLSGNTCPLHLSPLSSTSYSKASKYNPKKDKVSEVRRGEKRQTTDSEGGPR